MSFDHARRYLFRLYASSKESREDQVGRFGVGFWSILRFSPARIEIHSCTGTGMPGAAWAVELAGDLSTAREWVPVMSRGSLVVLEREIDPRAPADRGGDEREIRRRLEDAVWQNARFLRRRGDPQATVDVFVDGRLIQAEFALPPPSTRFAQGRMRGVVALGSSPGVELFSRGLRVRVAAALDDLLSDDTNTRRSRVRFVEMPEAMAPRILLEDDGLELLLNRSEARDSRRLERIVALANVALEELVERQIALAQPPSLGERASALARRLLGDSVVLRVAASACIGAIGGLALVASGLVPALLEPRNVDPLPSLAVPIGIPEHGPYRDLSARYEGPSVAELAGPSATASADVELRYTPSSARPYLAALHVSLDPLGRPVSARSRPRDVGELPQLDRCSTRSRRGDDEERREVTFADSPRCMSFAVQIGASKAPVRLPVPSGHALVRGSLRVDGEVVAPGISDDGLPTVRVPASAPVLVAYETGRATGAARTSTPEADFAVDHGLVLPMALRREMQTIRELDVAARVRRATTRVRQLVRYSTEAEVAAAHRAAVREETPLVDRALRIGAGDCDVQSALLVAMLTEAGVPARLTVGFVGREGRANPWLHAWVEWRDVEGRVHVTDPAKDAIAVRGDDPVTTLDSRELVTPESREGQTPPPRTPPVIADTPPEDGDRGAVSAVIDEPTPALLPDEETNDRARAAGILAYQTALAFAERRGATTSRTAPEPGDGPLRDLQRWATLALLVSVTTLAVVGLALWWRRRLRGTVELTTPEALAKLMLGALSHPGAFHHVPALFDRRLVPCLRGRNLSLREARTLARDGLLVHSAAHGPLARHAARRGTRIVDAADPRGRIVASSLAALDLDRWERRMQHGDRTPLTLACERALATSGLSWRIVVVRDAAVHGADAERVAALDLASIGLAPRRSPFGPQDVRVVAIDPTDATFLGLSARFTHDLPRDPSVAPVCVFALVDHLLACIAAPAEVRARVLEPLARAVSRARPLAPRPSNPHGRPA